MLRRLGARGSGHDLVARESLRKNQLSREDAQEYSERPAWEYLAATDASREKFIRALGLTNRIDRDYCFQLYCPHLAKRAGYFLVWVRQRCLHDVGDKNDRNG